MNLLMVRHGEVHSNIKKVYAGKSPEPLTEKGVGQAEDVSEKLTKYQVSALYSSPIQRAFQTAHIIGKEIGKNVVIEDSFRELEMGPWEGMSENDVEQTYPLEWNIWQTRPAELRLPGRETLDDLLKRVLAGLQKVYHTGSNRNIIIVTHVAIIRVLLLWHSRKSLNLYKTIHVPNAEIFNLKINSLPTL